MLRGLIRRFGLVPRRQLRRVEEKLQVMRQRLDKMTARLAQKAAATDRLEQARREEAKRYKARVAELEAEQHDRASRAREAAARASQRIGALEQALRARDAELEAVAHQETLLGQRVAAAMEDVRGARASLAVVEVKLDILEGAANILDRRTRPDRPQES